MGLIDFGRAGGRRVDADFDGGMVSSDAGALLLGKTDKAIGLVDRFAACFRDRRHRAYVLHEVKTLVAQRVFGLALGYEDLVDHDELRPDPILGVLLGKHCPPPKQVCLIWPTHAGCDSFFETDSGRGIWQVSLL